MEKSLKVVILAAGEGVRMKSPKPKVLQEVCGLPLLAYMLRRAKEMKPEEVLVVIGHGGEEVRKAFEGERIVWVHQKEQLGTGHALLQCREALEDFHGSILLLYGDMILITHKTLSRLLSAHRKGNYACTLLTAFLDRSSDFGRILRGGDGMFQRIVEYSEATEAQREIEEVNTGFYCFKSPLVFDFLKELGCGNAKGEYYLTDLPERLLSKGHEVGTVQTQDREEVLGVNSRKDLSVVGRIARRRIVERWMEAGVTIVDPETTFIDDQVVIGEDTVIHPFSVIRGEVTIGKGCEIGPFSHIRQGGTLMDGSEVGNFTEIKKSVLGSRTKVKHLSYIGDTSVGDEVNIGAGTIVANFDGKKKHRTAIGDNAFIGSGTILIAPVQVGKGGKTGAGAVVTRGHDVGNGEVVVGIPARKMKPSQDS